MPVWRAGISWREGELGMGVAARHNQAVLADRFSTEREHHVTRASSLFPVVIRPQADTILSFSNYWKIKNGVDEVAFSTKVFDQQGRLCAVQNGMIRDDHNELSIRRMLGCERFDGMVEIEFHSVTNLFYPFPALIAFYVSDGGFSAVHSSGRVRNPHEPRVAARSTETNWTCRMEPGVVPFFHLFNGPRAQHAPEVTVSIHDKRGSVIARRQLRPALENAYASSLVRLSDVFEPASLPGDFFVSVDVPDGDCFPRMVCGNLHTAADFLECTHSFYWSSLTNDTLGTRADEPPLLSFIPAPKPPELDLEMVMFPTNAAGHVEASIRKAGDDHLLRETGETFSFVTGGDGAEMLRYRLADDVRLLSFDIRKGPIPARLNASYRYSVRGANMSFATDIATGAHGWVYPEKHSHWGQGLYGDGVETVVMFRNIPHRPKDRPAAHLDLRVFTADGEAARKVEVPKDGVAFANLGELVPGGAAPDLRTLSWFARSDDLDVEAFWVSYSRDGRICGEHAF
jgi:hypothetical protein